MQNDEIDWGGWAETEPVKEAGEGYGEVVEAEFYEESASLPPATLDPQPVAAMLDRFKKECSLTVARSQEIKLIRDPDTNTTAVEWASQAKKLYKRLEDLRKEIVGPHNDFLREVNKFFKVYQEPLAQAEKYLARLIGNFRQFQENEAKRIQAEQEAEARKLQAQLEAEAKEAAKNDVHYEPAPIIVTVAPEVPKVTRTSEGSASQRKTWVCRIVDPDKVPREHCTPDQRLLNQAVKGGVRNIDGCIIEEEFTTQIRT